MHPWLYTRRPVQIGRTSARFFAYYSLALLARHADAQSGNAAAIYARSVRMMTHQSVLASVTYDETIARRGLGVRVVQGTPAVAHLAFSSTAGDDLFYVTQCGVTTTLLDLTSKQRSTAELPFWSPIWPQTATVTSVIGVARARMMNDLRVEAPDAYAATLLPSTIVDGISAYHVRLVARHDASLHPLTDLYADEQSGRILRAVAAFRDESVTDVTGSITLNFERVGNLWVAASGEVDATVHAYLRQVSGSATFSTSNVAFDGCNGR